MGNSVGFYAVADQLNAGRVSNPAQTDLDMLITERGAESRNVKRLSVTSINSQHVAPSHLHAIPTESIDMETGAPSQNRNSVESCHSGTFCSEVQRDQEAREMEEGHDCTVVTAASSRNTSAGEAEQYSSIDNSLEHSNFEGPSETAGLNFRHFCEETYDNNVNARLEEPDPCRGNDASASPLMEQPSAFIQSLLQELEENETVSNENIGLLDEDDELLFPVLYTASNPSDWQLGTLKEETPTYWQRKSNCTLSSASDLAVYDSSEEDGSLTIGSVVNVNNIDAEREKEEGIQLCLEPFENKIGKIEECLLNSGEIYKTTDIYKRRKVEDMENAPVQSSVDVSTVIQGNHNITYLRFGAGLEDDVTSVVASEYSGSSTTQQTVCGEDKMFSHIHMVIKDVTVCTREGGASEATAVETRTATLLPGPRFGRSLSATGESPYLVGWEGATVVSEDQGSGALQVPKMAGNWQHLYGRQSSADVPLGLFAEKSGSQTA